MNTNLTIIVERGRGKNNFSCFATEKIGNFRPIGYGGTARECIEDLRQSIDEMREIAIERGESYPTEINLKLSFDLGAFFNYYPLDTTAVAHYIGINPSVLRQYTTALRQPRPAQIERIRNGLRQLANDLGSGLIIDKSADTNVK